ncbi:MAG: DUF2628 domain-containing protein [Gammaproteobacteria bacterium]|nr:DUF2628 domain-containing protein [Gammaproteobacteria bacterium]
MSESPYSAPSSTLEHPGDLDLVDVAIGEGNTNYYLRYLQRAGERSWVPSWNWPAFFVTSPWMLYRKLWLEWFLYTFALPIVAILVGGLAAVVLGEALGGMMQLTIMFGSFFVLAPMYANALYARKVRRLVTAATAQSADREKRIQWLAKRGGTSLVWIIVLVLPFLIGILAAVAIPAYQDYVETANQARANAGELLE